MAMIRDECTIDGFMRVVQCKGVFPRDGQA